MSLCDPAFRMAYDWQILINLCPGQVSYIKVLHLKHNTDIDTQTLFCSRSLKYLKWWNNVVSTMDSFERHSGLHKEIIDTDVIIIRMNTENNATCNVTCVISCSHRENISIQSLKKSETTLRNRFLEPESIPKLLEQPQQKLQMQCKPIYQLDRLKYRLIWSKLREWIVKMLRIKRCLKSLSGLMRKFHMQKQTALSIQQIWLDPDDFSGLQLKFEVWVQLGVNATPLLV